MGFDLKQHKYNCYVALLQPSKLQVLIFKTCFSGLIRRRKYKTIVLDLSVVNKPASPYSILKTIEGFILLHVLTSSPSVQPAPSPNITSSASPQLSNFDTEI